MSTSPAHEGDKGEWAERTVVRSATRRTGHYHNVTRAQQDRSWGVVSCEAPDEEYRRAAEPMDGNIRYISQDLWKKSTHEIDTSGEVADISDRSTWAIKVSCRCSP